LFDAFFVLRIHLTVVRYLSITYGVLFWSLTILCRELTTIKGWKLFLLIIDKVF
jgi:hypothetical protein